MNHISVKIVVIDWYEPLSHLKRPSYILRSIWDVTKCDDLVGRRFHKLIQIGTSENGISPNYHEQTHTF